MVLTPLLQRESIKRTANHYTHISAYSYTYTCTNCFTYSCCQRGYKVKGLYLTGRSAGKKERMDYYIDLINRTELTLVIDIKNDDGIISYESKIPAVRKQRRIIRNLMPHRFFRHFMKMIFML